MSTTAAPHLMVEALAGTGKTSTMIEATNRINGRKTKGFIGSDQQELIWAAMRQGEKPESILFAAFNKAIATELQAKVPAGVDACTLHSLGLKALRAAVGYTKVDKWKTVNIIEKLTDLTFTVLKRNHRDLLDGTQKLVDLCKMTLVDFSKPAQDLWKQDDGLTNFERDLSQLVSHYDVTLNGSRKAVFELVPQVLEASREQVSKIDFADMIWLPIVNNYPIYQRDLLIVDEAQDLNRCQQELAMRAGQRLILIGDVNQSIYGWAGADTTSIPRMKSFLEQTDRGVETLHLTRTYRCCKAVVILAQTIVPEFEAQPDAIDGVVEKYSSKDEFLASVGDGDMVVCRVNAPLCSLVFRLLADGRKATIRGRDIGKGLLTLIDKLIGTDSYKANDIEPFLEKLDEYELRETAKLEKGKYPKEAQLIALHDKCLCLLAFASNAETIVEMKEWIEELFSDDAGEGIMLSSIHRAKGLEAETVFILERGLLPHPMAKSAWQQEQEKNLLYVAITRAASRLVECVFSYSFDSIRKVQQTTTECAANKTK